MATASPSLIPATLLPKPWGGRRLAAWGQALPLGAVIGEACMQAPQGLPLLLKLIDASQSLSVQVHPDDALARELHGPAANGKSELWVVLDADPGAFLYSGFKAGTTPQAFEAAVAAGSVESLLNRVLVQAGDAFDIPAGRIHAIGAGCLLAEVQQSSDLTYRVWDYGRPRELHLDAARRALRFDTVGCSDGRLSPQAQAAPWGERQSLLRGPQFGVERWALRGRFELPAQAAPRLLLVLQGQLRLAWAAEAGMMVAAGSALYVPARTPVALAPLGAASTLLSIEP